MAGNFVHSNQKLDLKLAIMHLNWNIPVGDEFVPWLKEVKDAGYDGITSFAHWGLETYIPRPNALHNLLDDHGLELAAVDTILSDDYESYKPILEFMQQMSCKLMVCIDPSGTEKDYARYGSILNRIGEMALRHTGFMLIIIIIPTLLAKR